jgi:hypothetical protein
MPGGQCTAASCGKNNNRTSVVTTGPPASPGISARNGFNGLFRALPGDEFVVTVVGGLKVSPRPVGPTSLRQLDTSNGCQDHTALPSAEALFVSHVPDRSQASINRRTRPATTTAFKRCRIHRIPHPTSVTIAIRPSRQGGTARKDGSDLGLWAMPHARDTIARRANYAWHACAICPSDTIPVTHPAPHHAACVGHPSRAHLCQTARPRKILR